MSEFREADSYLTDSESDEECLRPIAKPENSVLRMAHSLLEAARAHAILHDGTIPRTTIRFTRLDLSANVVPSDPRVAQTIKSLQEMGIIVELGPRERVSIPIAPIAPILFQPTRNLNLDVSVLLAFVFDTTHAPLNSGAGTTPAEYGIHLSLFEEISTKLAESSSNNSPAQLWTTIDAMNQCLQILEKCGGPNEKRRWDAMFPSTDNMTLQELEARYWKGPHRPAFCITLLPIHVFSEQEEADPTLPLPPFFKSLASVCNRILARKFDPGPGVIRSASKLPAYTVQTVLRGARQGWTTLTANKSSVKAIWKELKSFTDVDDDLDHYENGISRTPSDVQIAAFWILRPRA